MQRLNSEETIELLVPYYQGILEKGLLEPLIEISKSGTSNFNRAAKSLYDVQASGVLPQVAVKLMRPQLPFRVELLLGLGFEQSKLDYVLEDIIQVFRNNLEHEALDRELDSLLERYSNLTTEEICNHCSINEIRKLLKRAETEQATRVIIGYNNGYLVQKFLSAKLIEIREAAIAPVYDLFKQVFASESVITEKGVNVTITPLSKSEYQIDSSEHKFKISFED